MKFKFFILLLCSIPVIVRSQDNNYSQFYELPLLRNPALAGLYGGDLRVTSAYKNQWSSITVPYISEALGVEYKFGISQTSDNYISIGMQITNDVAGSSKFSKTQILPLIAFHKILNQEHNTYLSLAFMGGPVQQRFDASNLRYDDQYVNGNFDPSNPTQQTFSRTGFMYLDGSVGLTLTSLLKEGLEYYVGGAYFHFPRPKISFNKNDNTRLASKLAFNAGLSAKTSDFDKVQIYIDAFNQGGITQAQGGFLYKHDLYQENEDEALSISAGVFYRWNDAIMPLIKLDHYKLGIGLSYDLNVSRLSTASHYKGGLELSLSYKSYLNIKNSTINKTRCANSF